MKQRSAEILCIGTEILMGDIINTNAAYIAKELAGLGINVYHQSVVGDNPQRLKESLALAFPEQILSSLPEDLDLPMMT